MYCFMLVFIHFICEELYVYLSVLHRNIVVVGIDIRSFSRKRKRTVCPKSLAHFYIVSCYIRINKTSWTFSKGRAWLYTQSNGGSLY